MRLKLFYRIFLFLLTCHLVQRVSAQDSWKITAVPASGKPYYGITLANGIIGMVSSSHILQTGEVILAGAYDKYGRGGVSNFIPAFKLLNLNLTIDGQHITEDVVDSCVQVMDFKNATFQVSFKYRNKAIVTCQYYVLRHLPFAVMANYHIRAFKPIAIAISHRPEAPGSLKEVHYGAATILNQTDSIHLVTATAKSPNGRFTISAATTFIFDSREGRPIVKAVANDKNEVSAGFSTSITGGSDLNFSLIGGLISSAQHSDPENEAQRIAIFAALQGTRQLTENHRRAWRDLWKSDITITGDPQAQQDIHNMLYHLYAFVRAGSHYSLSPMGLSGLGYNGHIFWDADVWMLPVFLILHPELAKPMLNYRFDRLPEARFNAFEHGYAGAMFPWESADTGGEDTPVWALTGPYEHHISACVSIAAWNYYCATQDRGWLRSKGWPIISETADFWVSRVKAVPGKKFSIQNVVASDEWAENIDDDAFTNGAAITNLQAAVKAAQLLGEKVNPAWSKVAAGIRILRMPNGVTREHSQYHGEPIKQADVNLLAYPLSIIRDTSRIRRDLQYYQSRVPEKETPAMTYSIFALLYARLGEGAEAARMFRDSYEPNLVPPFRLIAENRGGNNPYFATGAGGVIQSILMGFGGLDITPGGVIRRKTALPSGWKSLRITVSGKMPRTYMSSPSMKSKK